MSRRRAVGFVLWSPRVSHRLGGIRGGAGPIPEPGAVAHQCSPIVGGSWIQGGEAAP